MTDNIFKLPLLQAISDWQINSSPKRAVILKEQSASLPLKFRSGVKRCYRQVALEKSYVWDLIIDEALKEKVSSWTINLPVAMAFKNGVPPQGGIFQGVILMMERPLSDRIILNINRLYKDRNFLNALDENKSSITNYEKGAGRYKNSQQEVVIEMESITKNQIRSLGGYTSNIEDLKNLVHTDIYIKLGRLATPHELAIAESLSGPSWLSTESTRRVLGRMNLYTESLQEIKRLQKLPQTSA
ncbi:hypothetical protein ACQYWY_00510 [Comamonas sediminis]|uniref:hypothetical protein n=1 Tax=Comamonas sediminis TaxID=1783360 RepID=UPI003D2BC684